MQEVVEYRGQYFITLTHCTPAHKHMYMYMNTYLDKKHKVWSLLAFLVHYLTMSAEYIVILGQQMQ